MTSELAMSFPASSSQGNLLLNGSLEELQGLSADQLSSFPPIDTHGGDIVAVEEVWKFVKIWLNVD